MNRSVGTFAVLAVSVLCACSKEAPKADSLAVAPAGASVPASAGSYDPTTRVATIIAKDFEFLAPDSIAAGWTTFRMVNEGPNLHHMQITRLDSGKTAADYAAAIENPNAPPPKWATSVGGPAGTDPKSESNATLNLQAGNYVMLCFVDIPGRVPHFTKGMVRPLTVTASAAAGAAPSADVTVALTDYAFTVQGASALTAGKHTIKVVNNGPQEHELQIIRLAPGKTMKDFGAWAQKFEGPPPANGLGGVTGLAKGLDGYASIDLTPGNYAFLCFVPAPDKKPHIEHGMVKEFTIN